jgi:hypothetical protein
MRESIFIKKNPSGFKDKFVLDLIHKIENLTVIEAWEKVNPELRTNIYITRHIDSFGNICYSWGGGITPYYNLTINSEIVILRVHTSKGMYILRVSDEETSIEESGEYDSSVKRIIRNIMPRYFWAYVDVRSMDYIHISNMESCEFSIPTNNLRDESLLRKYCRKNKDDRKIYHYEKEVLVIIDKEVLVMVDAA